MTEKSWSCPFCDFKVIKNKEELKESLGIDFRRSLGLARHNHLRKHGINTNELEQPTVLNKNCKDWSKESIAVRDRRLVGKFPEVRVR